MIGIDKQSQVSPVDNYRWIRGERKTHLSVRMETRSYAMWHDPHTKEYGLEKSTDVYSLGSATLSDELSEAARANVPHINHMGIDRY